MAVVAFDTLKLARALKVDAKMTQEQAEGVATALADAMSGAELATKSDLTAIKAELKADVAEVRTELQATKAELKADIALLSTRMDNMAARIEQQGAALGERIERRHAESDAKIQGVRGEIQGVRGEIQGVKNDLIKYVITTGVASVLAIAGMLIALARSMPH